MELESRGSGALDQRTVTVCSGLDLVNITYNNFVAADEKSADVHYTYSIRRSLFCRNLAVSNGIQHQK